MLVIKSSFYQCRSRPFRSGFAPGHRSDRGDTSLQFDTFSRKRQQNSFQYKIGPKPPFCGSPKICKIEGIMTTVSSSPQVFAGRIGRIEVSATMAVAAEAAKLRAQ